MDSDYLITCTENLLLQHGLTWGNIKGRHLQDIALLYLHRLLLKEATLIKSCTSLRVCTLSNNFITDISSLRACPGLIKLDLSGNQIEKLPDQEFWRELKELKLLYLHDNQIRSLSNVESLSFCPNLTALTMFDSPICLHKRYRHIVVNSIWSLKALDEYIISDEEIIEYWSLRGRFKAQNHHLYFNMLTVPLKDVQDLGDEMKGVADLISKINHVLSHCSPVLIVQRWIRGFLTRKRQGIIPPLKLQREILHTQPGPGKEDDVNGACVTKIVIRDLSALSFSGDRKARPVIKQTPKRVNNSPVPDVKRITVDLRKLQQNVLQFETPWRKTQDDKTGPKNCDSLIKNLDKWKSLPNVETNYDSGNEIHQNSIVSNTDMPRGEKKMTDLKSAVYPQKDHEEPDAAEKEDTGFRLLGLRASVYMSMSSKDLLASHEESARNMRECIQLLHSTTRIKEQAVRQVQAPKQIIPSKETGTMNMRPLYAVDKAYENRQKDCIQTKRKYLATQISTSKIQGKYNIHGFKEEKRKNATDQNEKDSIILQQDFERNQLTRLNFIEVAKQRQKQFSQEKQQKASEHSFVKEFSTQHTSVSNTLLKHDMMLKKEEMRQEKIRFVQRVKENKEQQAAFVKCLMEHRQLILQIENASEKASLNSVILQKAEDRLCEARGHVTSVKGQHVTAQPMFTIPVIQPLSQEMCDV